MGHGPLGLQALTVRLVAALLVCLAALPAPLSAEEATPALAARDLMADLRAADPFRQSGGRAFSRADRSRFLDALEREVRAAAAEGGAAPGLRPPPE